MSSVCSSSWYWVIYYYRQTFLPHTKYQSHRRNTWGLKLILFSDNATAHAHIYMTIIITSIEIKHPGLQVVKCEKIEEGRWLPSLLPWTMIAFITANNKINSLENFAISIVFQANVNWIFSRVKITVYRTNRTIQKYYRTIGSPMAEWKCVQ